MCKQVIRDNKGFLGPYFIFLLAGFLALLLSAEKGEWVLWVNNHYHPVAAQLFYYITALGNGWALVIAGVGLVLYRYRYAVIGTLAFLAQGFVIQLLKRTVFADVHRPLKHFDELADIHLVQGIAVKSYYAFPSGHTGSAFCLFCLLSLLTKNPGLQVIYFILALLAGFSRVYIFQHFLVDVLVGSLIGVGMAMLFYTWLTVYPPAFLKSRIWWDQKGLLSGN